MTRPAKYDQESILRILKEARAGTTTTELCYRYGISPATLYRWKRKYRAKEGDASKELQRLEEENAQLKRLLAEMELQIQATRRRYRSDS